MAGGSLLGTNVGNYVITGHLGQGGMGEVYLAEHPKIRRQVAIKVLTAQLSHQETLAQRFLSEAQAVARIDHPNVIDIYDFGNLDDGRLYYIMEVLKGCELRDVMNKQSRMTAKEILPYLQQICAGLQAAHDDRVIHRDLKPENIFVLNRDPLTVKILDFGIAKMLETKQDNFSLTSTGMVVGTPLYIAPEQAEGKPDRITNRTDLYSLGVILYSMLAGRPPFESDVLALLLTKHIQEEAPPLAQVAAVPRSVCRVVHQCLEKDPGARPDSATDLATAFTAAVEAAPESDEEALEEMFAGPGRVAVPLTVRGRSPAKPAVTTLGASAIELTDEDHIPVNRSPIKWLGLGAAAIAVLGVVLFVVIGRGGDEPAAPPPKKAAVKPKPPPPPPPKPVIRTVSVQGKLKGATCELRVGEAKPQREELPCTFEVPDKSAVVLRVERAAYKGLSEAWTVDGDRSLSVKRKWRPRRIVLDVAEEEKPTKAAVRPSRSNPTPDEPGLTPAKTATKAAPKLVAKPKPPKPAVGATPKPKPAPVAKPEPTPAPAAKPKPKGRLPSKVGGGTMPLTE